MLRRDFFGLMMTPFLMSLGIHNGTSESGYKLFTYYATDKKNRLFIGERQRILAPKYRTYNLARDIDMMKPHAYDKIIHLVDYGDNLVAIVVGKDLEIENWDGLSGISCGGI
jgi:hypothetical protein